MKKFALALTFAFAGAAFAQAPAVETHKPAEATKKAPATATEKAMQPKSETAEVVSVAADGATLTIKATPENKTLNVAAKAQASVKAFKSGEKVHLLLDDQGEVTEAKAAPATAKPHHK